MGLEISCEELIENPGKPFKKMIDDCALKIEYCEQNIKDCAQNIKDCEQKIEDCDDAKALRDEKGKLIDEKGKHLDVYRKLLDVFGKLMDEKKQLTSKLELQLPPSKKRKRAQVDMARDKTLNPSNCTWDILHRADIVGDYRDIYGVFVESPDILSIPTTEMTELILNNSIPSNEMFSNHVCFNVLCATVQYLNSLTNTKTYRVETEPVVMETPDDHRRDKNSVMRIVNKRTVAVIEVKLRVSNSLTGADKNNLAQLLYECNLIQERENRYTDIVAIYANHDNWHFFLINFSVLGMELVKRSSVPAGEAASAIVHYIRLLKHK